MEYIPVIPVTGLVFIPVTPSADETDASTTFGEQFVSVLEINASIHVEAGPKLQARHKFFD